MVNPAVVNPAAVRAVARAETPPARSSPSTKAGTASSTVSEPPCPTIPLRKIFSGIVENTTDQTLCFVQIELNLKQGTTTVVELGPQPVGDLAPDAQTTVELRVADEPTAVGVAYDAWEIHPETFACGGPGPVNTEGSGEGSSESGSETGGEQHGAEGGSESGGEGSEGGAAGNEEGGNALALDETFDMVRAGARLIMSYDAQPPTSFSAPS